MRTSSALIVALSASSCSAFAPNAAFSRQTSSLEMQTSRADFLKQSLASAAALTFFNAPVFAADEIKLPSGVSYVIVTAGDGPVPDVGELAAIRFKATYGTIVIDDIFGTSEPYYTRVGSGGLLKGIEEVIPKMRVGDRYVITIPSDMAFGKKGRPASAGKPRIPGDATIVYEVEMVGLPGKEPELIELIGDV